MGALTSRVEPSPTASHAFAVAGLAAAGTFVLLPTGDAQAVVFLATNGATAALVLAGVLTGQLAGPYRWLAAAEAVYLAASAGWYLHPVLSDQALPYPSVVDALYLISYLGWAAFLLAMLRRRGAGDPRLFLDGVAAGVGLGIVAWPLLLEPVLDAPGVHGLAELTSLAYPLVLLLLASLGLRLAWATSRVTWVEVLLVAWLVLELGADIAYSTAAIEGTFEHGDHWMAAWLVSYGALGALALHPRANELAAPRPITLHPGRRSLVLGGVLVLDAWAISTQSAGDARPAVYLMAAAQVAVMALVLVRLQAASTRLDTERALRAEVERLVIDLKHLATHDPLTGVSNRTAFDTFLASALMRRRAPGRVGGLLVLDLDTFKAVNDRYGHAAGDDLLRTVARRLVALVRPSDMVARIGGDEFAIVLDDIDVRTALTLAERVVNAVAEPVPVGSGAIVVAASVGVHAATARDTPSEALQYADAAMYGAKTSRGGVELYDGERHRWFIDRFQLEVEVRSAPARGELVLHYLPVVDLVTRTVAKAEALVRWNQPARGLLQPGAFIGVAEESGAIVEVGRWVLQQACADAMAWQDRPGGRGVGVAVNVSRRQLHSHTVVDDISDALDRSGLDPDLLTVEVTETALMDDTRGDDRGPRQDQGQGRPPRDGRLRDRLLVAGAPAAAPGGPAQDRPGLRRRHRPGGRGVGARGRHHPAGGQPREAHPRRGGGTGLAARAPADAGLRPGAGLAVRAPDARREARRPEARQRTPLTPCLASRSPR